ncbi:hypothetical protein [Paenibacillus rigui]|uniref:DUF4352 domain-containing protein n=1 Tax=Paenibacillus rigui TaxID=554312 RepID=A0A229UJA9_9BACL|nr:hypothetical protein [Paenibacillus rigui]OXM83462.1 hypothetical protein CF651_25400 [Paenibacillus rigui]
MYKMWGKTALALSLALSSASIYAGSVGAEQPGYVAEAKAPGYQALTDALQVQVKSVLNERTSDSVKIGVVIRLKNDSNETKRVPDYELRVRTEDGAVYTLLPSAGNIRSALPQSENELSYLVKLEHKKTIRLTELQWIDVDWNVYPKAETVVLTTPVSGQAWAGADAVIQDPASIKQWGEAFTIAASSLPLTYTPVDLSKQYDGQKTNYVVKMLVENTGDSTETVPELILEGKDGTTSFQGPRVEQKSVTIEPKEKKYIHFAIGTDPDSVLKTIRVLTPESFAITDAKGQSVPFQYNIGRIELVLPEAGLPVSQIQPVDYTVKNAISFDPLNALINPDVAISLVDVTMNESQGVGYKTAVAKFKLTNTSTSPIPVPIFGTELDTPQGISYAGSRQVSGLKQLMPNLTQVISYAFIIPSSEQGDHLVLKLSDPQTAAPFKSTIAALNVAVTPEPQPKTGMGDVLSFYPFEVKVDSWSIGATTSIVTAANTQLTYGYKLKLHLDVTQTDNVVVDQDFSKMKAALVDSAGRTVAEQNLSFTQSGGVNQVVSGELNIRFDNVKAEQQDNNMTLRLYESVNTEFGEAKRLLAVYK